MATFTFHVDDSSKEAQALLEFLRTLAFVKEDNIDLVLTDKHAAILEERRKNRLNEKSKTYAWDEVKNSLGQKKVE